MALEGALAIAPYLILSCSDDQQGMLANMAIRPSPWQLSLTTAGTVGTITGVLADAVVGFALAWIVAPSLPAVIGAAALTFALGCWVGYRTQVQV